MLSGSTDRTVIIGLPLTGLLDDGRDRSHRLVEAVVHHPDGIELTSLFPLGIGQGQPFADMGLRIASAPQPGLLFCHRRRLHEDAQGVGIAIPHLGRTLHIDLQQDIAARGRIGSRRAVEMAGDLGPLDEAVLCGFGAECGLLGEHIGGFGFAGATCSGCPRAAEPQCGVRGHKSSRDRPLADPAGAGQDDDQRLL